MGFFMIPIPGNIMAYNLITLFFVLMTGVIVYFSVSNEKKDNRISSTPITAKASNIKNMRDMTVGYGNHQGSSDVNDKHVTLSHVSPININLYKNTPIGTETGHTIYMDYNVGKTILSKVAYISDRLKQHKKIIHSVNIKISEEHRFYTNSLKSVKSEIEDEIEELKNEIHTILTMYSSYTLLGSTGNPYLDNRPLIFDIPLMSEYYVTPYDDIIHPPTDIDILNRLNGYIMASRPEIDPPDKCNANLQYCYTVNSINRNINTALRDKMNKIEVEFVNKYESLLKRFDSIEARIRVLERLHGR